MLILSLIFVVALLGIQIMKRPFLEKNLRKLFWIPVAAVFFLSAVFSVIQYNAWKNSDVYKIALEQTDGGMGGFFYNAFMSYFAPHLMSLALAGFLALMMFWLNKRSGGNFFEKEEILVAFLAGFLSGFPGFLFFMFGIVIAYLLAHLEKAARKKSVKSGVIPLYYFWLPVSASVILVSMVWLSKLEFWRLLTV